MARIRLIVDPPLDGPTNMARDEVLLDAVGGGRSAPTLRLYTWQAPTLSLGYFQRFDEVASLPEPLRSLPCVRRTTGGGAILHDRELTYSIAVPADHVAVQPNANRLYEVMHDAIIAAAGGVRRAPGAAVRPSERISPVDAPGPCSRRDEPFLCFARRHTFDVVTSPAGPDAEPAKLAGSAQRRTRQAVLQHGSIMLDSRYVDQPAATWRQVGGVSDAAVAGVRLVEALRRTTGWTIEAGAWTEDELNAVAALRAKYAGREWTARR